MSFCNRRGVRRQERCFPEVCHKVILWKKEYIYSIRKVTSKLQHAHRVPETSNCKQVDCTDGMEEL